MNYEFTVLTAELTAHLVFRKICTAGYTDSYLTSESIVNNLSSGVGLHHTTFQAYDLAGVDHLLSFALTT